MRTADIRKGRVLPKRVGREKKAPSAHLLRLRVAFSVWVARQPSGADRQEDFAALVAKAGGRDVSQNSVSRWFRGSVPKDLPTMKAIADALGVPAGWLYFGEGDAPARLLSVAPEDMARFTVEDAAAVEEAASAPKRRRGGE